MKTYRLKLTEVERADLERLLTKGKAAARTLTHARILLKASSHDGMPNPDRRYLAVLTANATGVDMAEATARADRQIAASERELRKARVAGVLQALFAGIALFVGAAVAWFSACEGGRDRENRSFPGFAWHRRRV